MRYLEYNVRYLEYNVRYLESNVCYLEYNVCYLEYNVCYLEYIVVLPRVNRRFTSSPTGCSLRIETELAPSGDKSESMRA